MDFNQFKMLEPMKYGSKTPSTSYILSHLERYKNYICSEKRDGEWCMCGHGVGDEVFARSRSLSKVTGEYGDKTAHLPHLMEFVRTLPENTILIGELCFSDISKKSKDVGAILRCLPEKAVERQKSTPLTLYVFDIVMADGIDVTTAPLYKRLALLDMIQWLPPLIVKAEFFTSAELPDRLSDIWANGGEGVVMIQQNSKYSSGRSENISYKIKQEMNEIECLVIGTEAATREYKGNNPDWQYYMDGEPVNRIFYNGWAAAIVVDHKGTKVSVASGLNDDDREWLASPAAQELIAQKQLYAVISGMEITESGSIRHPYLIRLRTEVN